jgi:putative nucleotidyltransferase with HDIG domain
MNQNLRTYLTGLEQSIGAELFFVGGVVRDSILGIENADVDLVSRGLSQDDLVAALSKHGRVEVTGAAFGVTRFFPSDRSIPMLEISLPRQEASVGVGHDEFEITFDRTLPIEDDLIRRDFSINALAQRVSSDVLIDPVGGEVDLRNGVLRVLHPKSPHEDPLRILRALRFLARAPFTVDPATDEALRDAVPLLVHVSAERIQEELLKILKGDHVGVALRTAQSLGIWKVILPELEACVGVEQNHYHSYDVFNHIVEVVQNTDSDDWMVKLAALLHDIAKPPTKWIGPDNVAHFYMPEEGQEFLVPPLVFGNHETVGADMTRKIMGRLKFSSRSIDRVAGLVRLHMMIQGENIGSRAARKLLKQIAELPGELQDNVDALFALRIGDIRGGKVGNVNHDYIRMNLNFKKIVDSEVEKESAVKVTDLAINGNDLKKLGLLPGPMFSHILNGLLDRVLENPDLNDRATLLEMVRGSL